MYIESVFKFLIIFLPKSTYRTAPLVSRSPLRSTQQTRQNCLNNLNNNMFTVLLLLSSFRQESLCPV